jgi:hypothetical protein
MQGILQRGVLQTAGYVVKRMLSSVWQAIHTFLRRKMISVCVFGLGIPKEPGMWRQNPELFVETSASVCLRSFMNTKPSGAAILWTVEGAGKSYTLAKVSEEFADRQRFIYMDWYGFTAGDFESIFYRKMGMDKQEDLRRFSTYLPNDVFTTIVFDHFDRVMAHDSTHACTVVSSLARDSAASAHFNILILTSSADNARELLTYRPFQHTHLIGPALCGKWHSNDVKHVPQIDPEMFPLIDQCGTLMPVLSNRRPDSLIQLRTAQLRNAWEEGERSIMGYRQEPTVVYE